MDAFHKAEKEKRSKPTDMFDDVYKDLPKHLENQKKELVEHLRKYQKEYPLELYEKF
jgi:2-oxoisovalerate dehydrogenase E1 component alpha subunit